MLLKCFRPVLFAALAALVLGVSLMSTSAPATASASEAGTLTTQLQPGWNMVAWLGSEAPVSELFDAVPVLTHI